MGINIQKNSEYINPQDSLQSYSISMPEHSNMLTSSALSNKPDTFTKSNFTNTPKTPFGSFIKKLTNKIAFAGESQIRTPAVDIDKFTSITKARGINNKTQAPLTQGNNITQFKDTATYVPSPIPSKMDTASYIPNIVPTVHNNNDSNKILEHKLKLSHSVEEHLKKELKSIDNNEIYDF